MEECVGLKSKLSKRPTFHIRSSAHKSHNAFENSTILDYPSVFAHIIPLGLGIPVSAQLI